MKICVFGASGLAGTHFTNQACDANHSLTLYVRPHSLSKIHPRLLSHPSITIVQGTFSDDFIPAITGCDAVVSFLGPTGPWWPSDTPLRHVMEKIMTSMRRCGVSRFITMGTPTMHDPLDRTPLLMRVAVVGISVLANSVYRDIIAIDALFRGGAFDDIDWTVARIGFLWNSEQVSGKAVVGYPGDGRCGVFAERSDWAHFVLVELERKEWIHKMPYISTPLY